MPDSYRDQCRLLRVGGQAVMEGVMMKGKNRYAVSVRRTDGTILTQIFDSPSITDKYKILNLPILRGAVRFFESFVIGIRTLDFSASFFDEEPESEKKEPKTAAGRLWRRYGDSVITAFSMLLGIVLALGLFILIPTLISGWLSHWIHSRLLLSLFEGVVRVAIFIGYILAISRMKDIRRLFEYHGAEHKTINCLEDGKSLTPENVKPYTRLNRRCGTSFIFLVMTVSILLFAVIYVSNPLLKVLFRILLLPLVSGISYEILMASNKYHTPVLNALVWPGLQLQKLTTREPEEAEIETAIASTLAVLDAENRLPEELRADWDRVRESITLNRGEGESES